MKHTMKPCSVVFACIALFTLLKEPFAWPHLAGTAFIVVGAVMLGWQ